MAEKFYNVQNTPNTVSADRDPEERGFLGTVIQSGKPVIDYEFQLFWDIQANLREVVRRRQLPSGFLKGQARKDSYLDFSFDDPADPGFTANTFHMRRQTAIVAGMPIIVEYTGTSTPGDNLIQLSAPPILGGTPPDVKRTDFVFLEVWLALVGPSPRARGTVTVDTLPSDGDTVTINGNVLTARAGVPGVDEFHIGANETLTAANMAAAINQVSNSYFGDVAASALGGVVTLTAQVPGAVGNALTLATSVPAVLLISGPTLTGGANRPNKPNETSLYRHGNTLCDSAVYLPDDLADPLVVVESAQRIQVQYRLRTTGQLEAIDFQMQPDGFSNPNVFAQGGKASSVSGYPFVPADQVTTSGSSDATTYKHTDPGLWIAGDGSSAAASALQTLDGYVYAIPVGFVFRRNDAYLSGTGAGFDPRNNANGALPTVHAIFSNPFVGSIAANTSDRPDNAFSDAINENDLLDLRRHVTTLGHDLQSELQWQMQSLMDGLTRTWAIDTSDKQELGSGSGDVSTRFLVANEIGRDSGHGGNNSTSGDTPRGVTIRNFDHIARRFGDQSVVERVVFELYPQDRLIGPVTSPGRVNPGKYVVKSLSAPGNAGWFVGDVLHIDLTSMNVSTDGTFDPSTASLAAVLENILEFAPPGTVITDVLSIYHDDGNWNSAVDQRVQATTIVGLGTGHVEITLDENPQLVSGGQTILTSATGSILLAGNPSPGDTITINGMTLVGVSGDPGPLQFRIGASTLTTRVFLRHAIAANFSAVVSAQAEFLDSTIYLTAVTSGAAGNSITLATSNPVDLVLSGSTLTGGLDGVTVTPMVGSSTDIGSPRRIFVELEVTYTMGNGLTDTPDYPVTPNVLNYPAGPVLENDVTQRPADMEGLIPPKFREGFREIGVEYVAGENGAGTPIGGITAEQFVSRSPTEIVFLRRLYGSPTALINVTDATTATPVPVDTTNTEYGSSSRKVVLGSALSGAQTLSTVTYFAQDPLPNYGAAGGGYQITTYFRSTAPQTVGVKDGLLHGGGGPLPQTLVVEPLLMSQKLWTGQTGTGSLDPAYPFALPMDQIPVNQGLSSFPGEWYFCATSEISIDDFNADTGLLHLPVFVPPAETVQLSFGGGSNPPEKDIEFRAFYGFADDTAYRPTVMSQSLSGVVRHKVFTPFLARATEDNLLFRKDEILLLVLTRWAELDATNTIYFTSTDNRTCVGVYRTRNLLILAGD